MASEQRSKMPVLGIDRSGCLQEAAGVAAEASSGLRGTAAGGHQQQPLISWISTQNLAVHFTVCCSSLWNWDGLSCPSCPLCLIP